MFKASREQRKACSAVLCPGNVSLSLQRRLIGSVTFWPGREGDSDWSFSRHSGLKFQRPDVFHKKMAPTKESFLHNAQCVVIVLFVYLFVWFFLMKLHNSLCWGHINGQHSARSLTSVPLPEHFCLSDFKALDAASINISCADESFPLKAWLRICEEEGKKNAIALVVTGELIAKTLYKRHNALEDFPKCFNNLNHSHRAWARELWADRTAAAFHWANSSGSIY